MQAGGVAQAKLWRVAARSRSHAGPPSMWRAALMRLNQKCRFCSSVQPMPPWTWVATLEISRPISEGRPPGLSSFKTLADESQFSKRLFEILVAKCEEGDMQAIKIVADRLWPRPRPEINVVEPQVVSFGWLHPGESETDRT